MTNTSTPTAEPAKPRTDDGGEILDPAILERQAARRAETAAIRDLSLELRDDADAYGITQQALAGDEAALGWCRDWMATHRKVTRAQYAEAADRIRRGEGTEADNELCNAYDAQPIRAFPDPAEPSPAWTMIQTAAAGGLVLSGSADHAALASVDKIGEVIRVTFCGAARAIDHANTRALC